MLVGGSLGPATAAARLRGRRRGFGVDVGCCARWRRRPGADRGAGAAGGRRRAARAGALALIIATFPGEERARHRPVDGVDRHGHGHRPARRRAAGRRRVVALDLRHQRPVVMVTCALGSRGCRAAATRTAPGVDVVGGVLCALGLAGPVFALIEQPVYGCGDGAASHLRQGRPRLSGEPLPQLRRVSLRLSIRAAARVRDRRAAHPCGAAPRLLRGVLLAASLGGAFRRQGVFTGMALVTVLSAIMFVAVWLVDREALWRPNPQGDFYAVVPHRVMVGLFGGVSLFVLAALGIGVVRFWRDVQRPAAAAGQRGAESRAGCATR